MSARIRFGLLPFAARLLLVLEFLVALNGKISGWAGQEAYMAAHGLRFVPVLLGTALAIEMVGSICLVTGFGARAAAATMFVYLAIVSVELHDFWNRSGNAGGMLMTEFFKNMGIMGGLLLLAAYGPGDWALGAHRARS
jgi:putative oxidoreductase